MAKPHRGGEIKKPGWRGTCPVCKRTGVKLLWAVQQNGADIKACKQCQAHQQNTAHNA